MPVLNNRVFTAAEIEIWKDVLSIQEKTRERDIVDIFNSGLKALNIRADKIPQLSEVNDKLEKITGFNAVYVPA